MATVTQTKCACEGCVCTVDTDNAIVQNDQYYCSEACANGHPDGSTGCRHAGCNCYQ